MACKAPGRPSQMPSPADVCAQNTTRSEASICGMSRVVNGALASGAGVLVRAIRVEEPVDPVQALSSVEPDKSARNVKWPASLTKPGEKPPNRMPGPAAG